jgi:ADP-ribose pyrophosphatase
MHNPIRRTDSRWVYEGNLIRVRQDTVVQPKGSLCTYEYAEIKPGVSVLAMHENGDVALVREWKYALERPSLEVVSGGVERGEDPFVAAQRELREEAGLEAREWIPMGRVDPFTTMLVCPTALYIARDLTSVEHEREEGEVMEVVRLSLREAVDLVMRSEITHASSCALILKTAEWVRSHESAPATPPHS